MIGGPTLTFRLSPCAKAPSKHYPGDAGSDLYATTPDRPPRIPAGRSLDIPTGVFVELPAGYYARIVGRSSAVRQGLVVAEAIIDNDYRGELFFYLTNTNDHEIQIQHHQRFAQVLLGRIHDEVEWREVDELSDSPRGDKGFGSSGK